MSRLGVSVSIVLHIYIYIYIYILLPGTPKKRNRYSGFCVLYNIVCRGLGWGVGFVVLVAGCFGFWGFCPQARLLLSAAHGGGVLKMGSLFEKLSSLRKLQTKPA